MIILQKICLVLILLALVGCENKNDPTGNYKNLPQFESKQELYDKNGDILNPIRLQMIGDTLFVSYRNVPRIDMYSLQLERVGSIKLEFPEPVIPTSFFVVDSIIYLTDHSRRLIIACNRDGKVLASFGKMPDDTSSLTPFGLTYAYGVIYVSDAGLRKVLAISAVNAEGITEIGELILTIPSESSKPIAFPSSSIVTPDGRLLIGDSGDGLIKSYTCTGNFMYDFDSLNQLEPLDPQGFAFDNIIDPSLQDTTIFDPSGVRGQGRIHVIDANNNQVHMFNPLGHNIDSYPESGFTGKPTGLAINMKQRKIFIAHPSSGVISVYTFGDIN